VFDEQLDGLLRDDRDAQMELCARTFGIHVEQTSFRSPSIVPGWSMGETPCTT